MVPHTSEVRGRLINSYLQFIKRRWGLRGVETCKKELGIFGKIKSGHFYPISVQEDILGWVREKKGDNYVIYAGRYTISKITWLRDSIDLNKLIHKMVDMYHELYDHGDIEYHADDEGIMLAINGICGCKTCQLLWTGFCQELLRKSNSSGKVILEDHDNGLKFYFEYDRGELF